MMVEITSFLHRLLGRNKLLTILMYRRWFNVIRTARGLGYPKLSNFVSGYLQ